MLRDLPWRFAPGSRRSARQVLNCSWLEVPPTETAMTSVATPASCSRTASSMAISQNGLTAILTLVRSMPLPSGFIRTLTFASTTRFTGTSTFMNLFPPGRYSGVASPAGCSEAANPASRIGARILAFFRTLGQAPASRGTALRCPSGPCATIAKRRRHGRMARTGSTTTCAPYNASTA